MRGLGNFEGKQKAWDGKQGVGSTITNHDAYNLAGIVNSSGQPLRRVTTDVSINQIQNKTSSGKNFPNFKKTFQIMLPILGFLLRILGHWFCGCSLNRYSLHRNLKHLFKRKRLTGWFPRQGQLCWSSLMLTFLIIFTYEIEERKNPYHFIKNQQKYDLFTKESLSLIGDIRSDYLQEQLSVWALSDLKFKNDKSFISLLMLLSGDIQLHPGPSKICQTCNKSVRKGLPCIQCGFWVHKRCDKIPDAEFATFSTLLGNESGYTCLSCKNNIKINLWQELPFADDPLPEICEKQTVPTEVNETAKGPTEDFMWNPFRKRGLHFLHLNINSLLPKIDELRLIAKNSNAAVIGITESKLDKTVLDSEVNIDAYEQKRSDRNRLGGGVACYIRKDLSFNLRENFSPDLENVFLDLFLPKSKPILVGILYRPPNSNGFLKKLDVAISKTENFDNQEVFILGDLNIDLMSSRGSKSNGVKRYNEVCSLHGLKQLIQEATRTTEKSETLLDHIISNSTQKISQHGVLNLGLSDHQLIYCTRKCTRAKNHDQKYIKIRSMKNYSRELFLKKLKLLDFPKYSEFIDINAAYSHFLQLIISVIDKLAPLKEIRVRNNTQEWMDEEVLEGIRIRDKLLSKFKKTKTHTDHVNFKKARNRVLSLIKKKKKNCVIGKLNENIGKPKELWRSLKSLGLPSKQDKPSKICLKTDGEHCFDDKINSNVFKEFFSNLAKELVKKLPNPPRRFGIESVKEYYKKLNLGNEKFKLHHTNRDNVLKLLEGINPSKAAGPDNLAGKFLKDGASILVTPMIELCNLSISLDRFPDDCKQAKLKPLFKKGSKDEPKNYRPISHLPQISKVIEKIVHEQILARIPR